MKPGQPISASDFIVRALIFSIIGYCMGSLRGAAVAMGVLILLYVITIARQI